MDDPISSLKQMKEAILEESPRLKENDTFQFACSKNSPCFTQCCGDVNIALTPYDVLRMREHLGISSGEFLHRYTIVPFSKDQKFPVVLLKMQDDERKSCHFVGEEGCSIYEDRPWACRMYPIGVASPGAKEEEKFYFIIKEDLCEGHGQGSEWSIASWMDDQGVREYDSLGEEFKEISLHPFFQQGEGLKPAQMDMLFMVLYDLDKFRRFVFETSFLEKFELSQPEIEAVKSDDVELLRLGFRWLKFCLFGEHTLEIKERVRQQALNRSADG
jgi:Fe-S-cluster containining protein